MTMPRFPQGDAIPDDNNPIRDEAKLIEAAKTLSGENPPAWLVDHFRRAVRWIHEFYASGGARLPRAEVKEKLIDLYHQASDLARGLDDWGGVFAGGGVNHHLVESFRQHLPKLLAAIEEAQSKNSEGLKTGPGVASMTDCNLNIKDFFAIAVFVAARKLQKTNAATAQKAACRSLWQASWFAKLKNEETFAGVKAKKNLSGDSWERPIETARAIEPRRKKDGTIEYIHYETWLMMGGRDFMSYLMIALAQQVFEFSTQTSLP